MRGWPWLRLAMLAVVGLVACSEPAAPPTTPLPVTRIVSVDTATPTQPPLTSTATPTPTASLTPTLTPIPPTATATPLPIVHFMAVGDLMLARTIGERIEQEGPGVVFAGVKQAFEAADLLVANLECVISDRGTPAAKAYVFRAPPAAVEALALAGVDVVSLANNHSFDYGLDAVADMLPRLQAARIQAVGAGVDEAAAHAPVIAAHNGVRIAFLAYVDVPVEGRSGFDTASWAAGPMTPGLAWAESDRIAADVAAARQQADIVVVYMHFGLEGRPEVTADQRLLARAAVDAGAALVLGAHPHVLQAVERYNGGLIAYSLGNFVFDGFGAPANYSAIFAATLTLSGVESYHWVPVVVEGGLPRLATPDEAGIILPMLREE